MYEEENVNLENNMSSSTNEDVGEHEVEPVTLSKKQTGFFVVGVLFLLIIVAYLLRGCSIAKEAEKTVQNKEPVKTQSEISTSGVSNSGDSSSKILENTAENVEVSPTLSEENNLGESSEVIESEDSTVQDVSETNYSSLMAISEPKLGEVASATQGIVKSKNVYFYNNSYIYNIDILFVAQDTTVKECSYFCPKKTYDALVISQPVHVDYQMDSQGNVSIISISN